LLLVCDAVYAMPFVLSYVQCLNELNLEDGELLRVGIGVAVAKKTFPFHRSRELAEDLARGAKRQDRQRSMVDWLAISEAWHEDVAVVRRRDFRASYSLDAAGGEPETLILTCKPYPVLGEGLTLESLLKAAESAVGVLPRSQLMALADSIPAGRRQADWAVRLLDDKGREALAPAVNGHSAWSDLGDGTYSTALLDFLELFELARERQRSEMNHSVPQHAET